MAVLSNTLYTIENGSKVWRHIINRNFNDVYSIAVLDSVLAGYSDTAHTHSEYKLRSVAETDVRTALSTSFGYDIATIGSSTGFVFLDRTTSTYKRLYVSDGVLLVEVE